MFSTRLPPLEVTFIVIVGVPKPESGNFVAARSRNLSMNACELIASIFFPFDHQSDPPFTSEYVFDPSCMSTALTSSNPKSKSFLLRKSSSALSSPVPRSAATLYTPETALDFA